MSTQTIKSFLTCSLYTYDKQKVNWLKAILPMIVIVQHIQGFGFTGVEFIASLCDKAMFWFFAMSGYGLVISYLHNERYLNGFLKKSLSKLFIPYLAAVVLFVIYRYFEGIDQIVLFKDKGLYWFVPTSWYIYVLSYFYIFFYIVFRFVKANNTIKAGLLCVLVMAYVFVAPHIGVEYWRYARCPAFCVGVIFALLDDYIRGKYLRWHMLVVLALIAIYLIQPIAHRFDVYAVAVALFVLMYSIKDIKTMPIVKFLSSISLEMFILQFLPIYFVVNDLQLTSTAIVVPLVIVLDIILAYIVHIAIRPLTSRLR